MPSKNHSISIIVPVLNEELCIGELLNHLNQNSMPSNSIEIICVDGGSTDKTPKIATQHGAKVVLSQKGRAKQMNLGAEHATGDILYFLHADTFPPNHFDQFILKAVNNGFLAGCFRMQFDTKNLFLRFFAWFSRFNLLLCRGGDQSLFVERELFKTAHGFNEAYRIYEDTEFIDRLYRQTKFKVLSAHVVTSARKYQEIGTLKLQFHFAIIHLKKYLGAGPEELYRYYKKFVST
ncbi:TIGR04283 family arsenosugar biosynthesis glycosyltransferase [Muricauda sp. MAR_2010_75]|uniref:TIGR04283 family arsenosugar biosynthesis glycosyltransferase n=1 Tax=Allomuricauda sp. MAR_2010_75 TaxID=1250232 RepID=UPI000559F1D8|nr:TIGR04283 family arsenosugar biosynthesis glycosyltransferase [Muricauda sp. MAR_2010_75]